MPSKDEVRERVAAGKGDGIDWCAELEWYGDGICDEFCAEPDPDCAGLDGCFVGGCSGQVCSDQPGVITTCEYLPAYACYQDATCERQGDGTCGWTPTAELDACLAAHSPRPPDACEDGNEVAGPDIFVASADGKECALPSVHCITDDGSACPQLSPLPPDFCADGTLVQGPPSFVSSADGKECQLPSIHCVTNDGSACPQLSPLPPDYCADGTLVQGPPSFVASADGKECKLPSIHCVTNDGGSCPQL